MVSLSRAEKIPRPDKVRKALPPGEIVFTEQERVIVRDYFRGSRSGLPPGLAKRDRLPPGLEKQLRARHAPTGTAEESPAAAV